MLYMVIDRVRINFEPVDVSLAQLKMLAQTFRMYEDYKAAGKLKAAYAFADTPGGISIWDVESNEELQRILFLLPSMSFMEREVRPLTSMESVDSIVRELTEIVKSMPSKPKG
ncbi:MAG: muconolactone Delta-isomerase family protein [Candidatus Nitrosocaldus sp.]|nr:muconolactone Delta-isomerase family protein [Candidatus Nitrosocaldus sp.]MCS7141557.1 muconolactone Delta-isomerase family protein [Candidatus Nitrosocaldus sp.]MDW8000323.1 muconolactone Delta-isomerase family protein [Candidatus Nitrosocaldus sp.]MDW8275159.1 muconolactone Delta-isomerase family protein [Candidatus Nitrosocaldus sp.]